MKRQVERLKSKVSCDSLPWEGGGRGFSNMHGGETPPCLYTPAAAPLPWGGNSLCKSYLTIKEHYSLKGFKN